MSGRVVTCGQNGVPLDNTCQRLFSDVTPVIQPFLNGPVFSNANYTSSPTPTQITDAIQRAEFGNHARDDWHTLLSPSVKTAGTMTIVQNQNAHGKFAYRFALNPDGSRCFFVLIRSDVFDTLLVPQNPAGPDNNSISGQAELAAISPPRTFRHSFFRMHISSAQSMEAAACLGSIPSISSPAMAHCFPQTGI